MVCSVGPLAYNRTRAKSKGTLDKLIACSRQKSTAHKTQNGVEPYVVTVAVTAPSPLYRTSTRYDGRLAPKRSTIPTSVLRPPAGGFNLIG
eukprot:831916-Heterocapsa_arctica.AAC.1